MTEAFLRVADRRSQNARAATRQQRSLFDEEDDFPYWPEYTDLLPSAPRLSAQYASYSPVSPNAPPPRSLSSNMAHFSASPPSHPHLSFGLPVPPRSAGSHPHVPPSPSGPPPVAPSGSRHRQMSPRAYAEAFLAAGTDIEQRWFQDMMDRFPPSSGLPAHLIALLPSLLFKDSLEAQKEERCPICLDDYGQLDTVMGIAECGHFFHKDCFQPWLKTSRTCPYCRQFINPKRPGGGSGGGRKGDGPPPPSGGGGGRRASSFGGPPSWSMMGRT